MVDHPNRSMRAVDFIGKEGRAVYRTLKGGYEGFVTLSRAGAAAHHRTMAEHCADFERRCGVNGTTFERLWFAA